MVQAPATNTICYPRKTRSWRAEEAGLMDGLFGRDRTTFMREEHRSQCTHRLCGLEDGLALRCFQQGNSRRHDADEGVGLDLLTAQARAARRRPQAPSPKHVESRR